LVYGLGQPEGEASQFHVFGEGLQQLSDKMDRSFEEGLGVLGSTVIFASNVGWCF
jgi:hypothetical protein